MVLFETSDEWQRQSSLLLQARPATARITVKYNLPNLQSAKYVKARERKARKEDGSKDAATAAPAVPKAVLCLKTYDPASGVCLKFKTDRAAEVGRLINGLGKLGRHMAALPQKTEDAVMEDAPEADAQTAGGAPAPSNVDGKAHPGPGGAGGGGGGKKKKKGKK